MTPGITNFTYIANDNLTNFGFVAYNREFNEIVVAFRGTHNDQNWAEDMNSTKIEYQRNGGVAGMKVHAGFYNVYETLKEQIDKNVKKMIEENPDAKITVTGHSMGASVATLAAVDLKIQY
jgi:predicted lipase